MLLRRIQGTVASEATPSANELLNGPYTEPKQALYYFVPFVIFGTIPLVMYTSRKATQHLLEVDASHSPSTSQTVGGVATAALGAMITWPGNAAPVRVTDFSSFLTFLKPRALPVYGWTAVGGALTALLLSNEVQRQEEIEAERR